MKMSHLKIIKRLNLIWLVMLSVPLFLTALYLARFSPRIQLEIFIGAVLTYLITAIIHHQLDKSLTLEIVVEYILIAILTLVVFQSLVV